MGYTVNNYRDEWKYIEDCDTCSTANNPVYTNPKLAQKHAMAVNIIGTLLGTGLTTLDAIGAKKAQTEQIKQIGEPINENNREQKDSETKKLSSIEIENNVKKVLGETTYNALSEETRNKIIKKYETINNYSQQNNIEISDTEMNRRLNAYANALESKNKQIEMGKAIINGENYNQSIVNEEIKKQKATGSDEEYLKSLLNRGTGTVQIYDNNGDNLVTFNEFLSEEAKDWKNLTGEDIDSDMEAQTEKFFKKLDKNSDNKLDEVELASHEFARATLYDTDKNSNEELTFKEYCDASAITMDKGLEQDYDRRYEMLYKQLRK